MKIVFMGTPQAAAVSLKKLINDGHDIVAVYTQPDRASGRGNKVVFSPVKEFALSHGLDVWQPVKIRTPEALERFRSHDADVTIVVAYGRILPESFLTAYPGGAINVHFSLLPKYRGAAPVNWAIVNGEHTTGVTTIKMDAGLDTGPVLLMQASPIGDDENAIELMTGLSNLGAAVLSETLDRLDELVPVEQDHEKATFAPILDREQGRIDWQMDAPAINNRIRGFQPFPTAYTYLDGEKLTFWRGLVSLEGVEGRRPGEVIRAFGDDLLIACGGDSALQITELQAQGKRRLATRDFLNGFKLKVGTVLG